MKEKFEKLLQTLDNDEIDIIDKLSHIINFIRPADPNELDSTREAMQHVIAFFQKKDQVAATISDEINLLLIGSKISTNISSLGILSRDGFRHELHERFYNKFLPKPPKKGDFGYIFTTLFHKKEDHLWVNRLEDEEWIAFFASILSSESYQEETKDHLFSELLYAAEIISIWIASEEFNDNFIRLDRSLLNKDSAFIALERDINDFIHKIQAASIDLASTDLDLRHIQVLIEQCREQVNLLKKKSINKGISVDFTYELERLGQMIQRIEEILNLIKKFDTPESYLVFMKLFKESVKKNATRNSLLEVYQQSIRVVAKSVTNNTSEHGEHYITQNMQQYIKMLSSAGGAGIIIALMALIKINIMQAGYSEGTETLFASLNYGLGFVLIHLLGFTIATKQPAMTASTFAKAIEKEERNRANQKKLVALIIQVNRSQFAAVFGNVALALLVAFGIAYIVIGRGDSILSPEETQYYLQGLQPYPALIFAAIAGIWLFCSGLIAGYFDNRANLLELKERYFYHPLLKKFLKDEKRETLACFLHEHHGAMAGNFFFGILLGITPYLGSLLDLPLDIRHVAFSTAYLGYSSMHIDISMGEFFLLLLFVLLIGLVNLSVSFILALKVSLLSRDSYFGNFFSFVRLLAKEVRSRPLDLFFPPKTVTEEKKDNAD
ncbi:MAG TPA: hypothetical protein VIM88_01650 [Sulfurovum sp.]|uniref:hypothetical protein n=1 Tax=Sulfurovum sp. TaxID=1969726 RepID=UPI002F9412F3